MTNILFTLLLSILIHGQEDFDRLQDRISDAYAAGETRVDIHLDPTIYFFREKHLHFVDMEMPGLEISFHGNGSVIVGGDGNSVFDIGKGYVDLKSLCDYDTTESVKKARFWPIKVPFRKGVYCIPVNEPDMSEEEAKDISIVLSQWFQGKIYKVIRISGGMMYFRRDEKSGTRMHTELRYGRCLPRYIMCRPPERTDVHCCSASNFLTVHGCSLGNVSFRGIKFLGNSADDKLLCFNHTKIDSVIVERCSFEGIRSDVLHYYDTDNLFFTNNLMTRCYRSGVLCDETADNCTVTDNRFIDNGRMMINNCIVRVQGSNILVRNNLFEDFSYIGIKTGTHYTSEICETEGVICENELRLSEEFRKGVPRMLIDGGTIYCLTRNKDIVIRDNYIHDISGPHGNRGILADDGSVNVTICGNRILNVSDSYCIDIRKAKRVGRRRNSKIKEVNIGNKIYDNVYDGRVRIYVDPSDSSSFSRNNTKL